MVINPVWFEEHSLINAFRRSGQQDGMEGFRSLLAGGLRRGRWFTKGVLAAEAQSGPARVDFSSVKKTSSSLAAPRPGQRSPPSTRTSHALPRSSYQVQGHSLLPCRTARIYRAHDLKTLFTLAALLPSIRAPTFQTQTSFLKQTASSPCLNCSWISRGNLLTARLSK